MMRQGRSFFAKPNDLLFTHIHEDHYDQTLVNEFQQRYPGRIVYAPGLDKDNIQPVVLEHGTIMGRTFYKRDGSTCLQF